MLGLFGGSFPLWVTHAQACYSRQREVFNILKLLATHFCLALYSLQSSSVTLISLYPYNVPVRGKLASGRLRMNDGNGRDRSRARFEYKPPDTPITALRDTIKDLQEKFRRFVYLENECSYLALLLPYCSFVLEGPKIFQMWRYMRDMQYSCHG